MKIYHLLAIYNGVEMFFWTHKKPEAWLESAKKLYPKTEISEVYASMIDEKEARYKNAYSRFGEPFDGSFKDFVILAECFGLEKTLLKHDDDGNLTYRGELIATVIL